MATPVDKSGGGSGEPAVGWRGVSPSSNLLPFWPRGIYVGTAGTLNLESVDGDIEAFDAAAAGYHPLRPIKILPGTTATGIKILY